MSKRQWLNMRSPTASCIASCRTHSFKPCAITQLGSAVAWWLMPRTPDPEVGGSSPTRVKPCCVLEQGIFTPQKVLVIPRKRWLCPNMTEKVFTGTLRINQPTNQHNTAMVYSYIQSIPKSSGILLISLQT